MRIPAPPTRPRPSSAKRRSRIALRSLAVGAALGAVVATAAPDIGHAWFALVLGGASLGWILGGVGALLWDLWRVARP